MTNNDIFDIALSLVDTLPLGIPTYTSPCLIGAMLSPAARVAAQVEADDLQDRGFADPPPYDREVPELRSLCREHGGALVDLLQRLHDDVARAHSHKSVEERRAVLRERLTDLRRSQQSKEVQL